MPIVIDFNSFSREPTQNFEMFPVVPVVPAGAVESGNTRTTDSTTPEHNDNSKRIDPALRWCFTYNNPNEKFKDFLLNHYRVTDCVFQLEVGKKGTPHYQGVLRFDCKSRPVSVFGPEYKGKIHWEVCRDWDDSVHYCQKPEGRVKGPWFKGARCRRVTELKILKEEQLYDWQRNIIDIIEQEPDDRKIYWIWESEGNRGKTSFCKYLSVKYQAILLTGKSADMKYSIAQMGEYPRIILIDCPRSMMEYISYPGIEEIKNAYFFAGKYESKQVIGNPPHLFIFANSEPDTEKLSQDRWEIINI